MAKKQRRRRRRRRSTKGGGKSAMNIKKTTQNLARTYKETMQDINRNATVMGRNRGMQRITIGGILNDTPLLEFIQATTHPFGPEGIGAMIPDAYDNLCVATYDTLATDINLVNLFSDVSSGAITAFDGFICAFLPRCLASGLLSADNVVDSPNLLGQSNLSFVFVDSDFTQIFANGVPTDDTSTYVFADPYYLLLIPVNENGHGIVKFTTDDDPLTNHCVLGAYIMRMPRMPTILSDCLSFRIAGAGVKVNPRTAPLVTDGVSFSGQIRYTSLVQILTQDLAGGVTVDGPFKNFNVKMAGAFENNKGVLGSTARYNIFQNMDQLEKQACSIAANYQAVSLSDTVSAVPYSDEDEKDGYYVTEKYAQVKNKKSTTNNHNHIEDVKKAIGKLKKSKPIKGLKDLDDGRMLMIYAADTNTDPAVNDLCAPGDMVPVVYYQFNAATPLLLQLRAVAHGVAEPKPEFPFLSKPVRYDPLFEQMKGILGNPSVFPLNASGNSFKSALGKFNRIFAQVLSSASRLHKFSKLAENI
jgi:hypothetical protein